MATIDTLPATFTPASPDLTRIRPSRGWRAIDLREVLLGAGLLTPPRQDRRSPGFRSVHCYTSRGHG